MLPSLLILIALSWVYLALGIPPAVSSILYGIKPAEIAFVALAAHRIGSRVFVNAAMWIIAAAAFFLILRSISAILACGAMRLAAMLILAYPL